MREHDLFNPPLRHCEIFRRAGLRFASLVVVRPPAEPPEESGQQPHHNGEGNEPDNKSECEIVHGVQYNTNSKGLQVSVGSLAAITDYAQMAALAATGLSETSFGYSVWVKPTTALGNGSSATIDYLGCYLNRTIHPSNEGTGFNVDGATNTRWVVYTDAPNGYSFLEFEDNAGIVIAQDTWASLMAWVTITPGTTTRTVKMWVDGVPLTVSTLSAGSVAADPSAWSSVRIGNRNAGTNPFAGNVAEFALLNREPTDLEAEKHGLLLLAPPLIWTPTSELVYYNPLRDTADLTAPVTGSGSITLAGNAAMDDTDHPEIVRELVAGGGARSRSRSRRR